MPVASPTRDRRHKVAIVVEGYSVERWLEYEIATSMIEPASAFTITRPFDLEAWTLLRRDARVRVTIDGATILDGLVDTRTKSAKAGTMTIGGRDKAGRLVQDAAPSIAYGRVNLLDAVKKLAAPWFQTVTLSDFRNRNVRRGKGRKAKAGGDDIHALFAKTSRKAQTGVGQMRWQVIEEIVGRAGYCAWSSADGRELVIGRPNYKQEPQYLLQLASSASKLPTTVLDMRYAEDNGDRYAMIQAIGSGGGTEADFGQGVATRSGIVVDNEDNVINGTGRDFLYPKTLVLPEGDLDDNADASRRAAVEAARRDFKRTTISADMDQHGQWLTAGACTLFAPNTIARVVDEELELDDTFLLYAVTYKCSASEGQTSSVELVPTGTEMVL